MLSPTFVVTIFIGTSAAQNYLLLDCNGTGSPLEVHIKSEERETEPEGGNVTGTTLNTYRLYLICGGGGRKGRRREAQYVAAPGIRFFKY